MSPVGWVGLAVRAADGKPIPTTTVTNKLHQDHDGPTNAVDSPTPKRHWRSSNTARRLAPYPAHADGHQRDDARAIARPTVVSLYSGAGGMDLGFARAGCDVLACIDNNADATATLRANRDKELRRSNRRKHLANAEILCADVADVSARDLCSIIGQRAIDIVVGGPPCQPFSSAGARQSLKDSRGEEFLNYAQLVRDLQPQFVVLENVRGLATARGRFGHPGGALREMITTFEKLGYFTSVGILNAADFGVPQRRQRLIIIMSYGATPPEMPAATHAGTTGRSGSENGPSSLLPWNPLGQFLADRVAPPLSEWTRPSAELARQLRGIPNGRGLRSAGTVESTRPGGHWGYRQGAFIADPSLPARTITGSCSQDWIRLPDGSLRRLTLRECAALQGFPEEWVFCGSQKSQFQQVGNALPPAVGSAIAKVIIADRISGGTQERAGASRPFPAEIVRATRSARRESMRNGASRKAKIAKRS